MYTDAPRTVTHHRIRFQHKYSTQLLFLFIIWAFIGIQKNVLHKKTVFGSLWCSVLEI